MVVKARDRCNTSVVGSLFDVQRYINGASLAYVYVGGPRCSRCLGPLRVHVSIAPQATNDSIRYRCADGCASVPQRWMEAARKLARRLLWGTSPRICSRCGTRLLICMASLSPNGYWCPGCGPVDNGEVGNWHESQRIAREALAR